MKFLENLSKLLATHNMSKKELAKNTGISYSTINSWFNRGYENVSLRSLVKLSNYFDVSIEELVNGKDENELVFSKRDYTADELKTIRDFVEFIKHKRKEITLD